MPQNGEIVLTDIQETQWDEEAVLDSPFEAKDFVKVLPWKTYAKELDEYGSLREKARDRDMGIGDAALDAVEAYEKAEGFPDDFATHVSWNSQISKWTIDADAFNEARKFWEFVGFDVSIDPAVDTSLLQ